MSIFKKAAKTAFKVAEKLKVVHSATFKTINDNGIDEPIEVEKNVEIIKENFSLEDIRGLRFRDKIQPTDIKLYVLGESVQNIDTNDIFVINGIEYTVFGCEIDAANAMWICGVR